MIYYINHDNIDVNCEELRTIPVLPPLFPPTVSLCTAIFHEFKTNPDLACLSATSKKNRHPSLKPFVAFHRTVQWTSRFQKDTECRPQLNFSSIPFLPNFRRTHTLTMISCASSPPSTTGKTGAFGSSVATKTALLHSVTPASDVKSSK